MGPSDAVDLLHLLYLSNVMGVIEVFAGGPGRNVFALLVTTFARGVSSVISRRLTRSGRSLAVQRKIMLVKYQTSRQVDFVLLSWRLVYEVLTNSARFFL